MAPVSSRLARWRWLPALILLTAGCGAARPMRASASPTPARESIATATPVAVARPSLHDGGSAPESAPSSDDSPSAIVTEQVTIDGSAVPAGRARGEIAASLDVVASVATDFAHYHEFLPQLSESRVIHHRRNQADVYLQVQLMHSFGTLWSLTRVSVHRTPDSLVVDAHGVQGNVSRFEMRIEAVALRGTGHTAVTVTLLGLPVTFFPTSWLAPQQPRWAARELEAMRSRAEAVGLPRHPPTEPLHALAP